MSRRSRDGDDPLAALATALEPLAGRGSSTGCAPATTTAHLEAGTAVRLASVLRYATGIVPLDAYQVEFGKVGTPSTVVEDLTAALTKAIEELTRPIDAIKHQAKTVTVGISRSDETLLQVPLVQRGARRRRAARQPHLPRAAHARRARPRGRRGRRAGPATASRAIDDGDDDQRRRPRRHRASTSRRAPTTNPVLRGTQAPRRDRARGHRRARPRRRPHDDHRARGEGQPDDRPHARCTCGSTTGSPATRRARVLEGYRDRYQAIADQVTETEPVMRDDVLGTIDFVDLLTEPVVRLADSWRA